MTRRPISPAEMHAAKMLRGGWTCQQFRLWGVSCPPKQGWRKRLLQTGVPAACPMPAGFVPSGTLVPPIDANPLLAFGPPPSPIAMPADAIEIFTDGSCDSNPETGGWGFAVFCGAGEVHSAYGGMKPTTNNQMELTAVIQALRWLDPARPAIVWTDSQYVQKGCILRRHGWKRKNWTRRPKSALANAGLWQELDELLESRVVDVRWTRSHVGTAGNERADELAKEGRQSVLEKVPARSALEEQLRAPVGF